MLLKSYEEDLKQFNFRQRAKTIFGKFVGTALKTWKLKFDPTLSSFNPYPSLSSVAIDDTKQLNNKSVPLFFDFNWCEDTF